MLRPLLTLLAPPLAVCLYGCARCCAAPIGVFWLSGIGAMIYGALGGPASLATTSWVTVLLGIGLWVLASVWAMTVIKNTTDPQCEQTRSPLCQVVNTADIHSNPLDEVKRFY
ncbi:MAG: hypothetical protein HY080_09210 [Gammaproteobacteria bacterium]|nr:hypothetical protein [Gammaproteobacteria bacterium]